jgi:hypothetical protein
MLSFTFSTEILPRKPSDSMNKDSLEPLTGLPESSTQEAETAEFAFVIPLLMSASKLLILECSQELLMPTTVNSSLD